MRVRLILLAALGLAICAGAGEKPNIVFFLVDDMGWQETSVPFHTERTELNRRYQTPNMERLAAEGVKFTSAYASAVCSPSRVSGLTGMNAARHHVTCWTLRKDVSPDQPSKDITPPEWNMNGICATNPVAHSLQVTPLPALLRGAGYRTIHVGKAHFGAQGTSGENPLNLGFDVNISGTAAGGPGSYWGEKNFSAAWRSKDPRERIWDVPGLEAYLGKDINLTEALTLEAIKQLGRAVKDNTPFYLYMAHYAVHAPYEQDHRFYQKYLDRGLKGIDAIRASMLESMDKSLGDIVAELRRLHVDTNTVILFASDNGAPREVALNRPLRGYKLGPYEGGTRIPMIAQWPGVTRPGTVCARPVIIEDFFPTILEIAGADWRGRTIQQVDGMSFVPLLRGEAGSGEDRAFVWHYPHYYSQTPFSALRDGAWKLIYHHIDRRLELYNLVNDLSEKTNLAAKEPGKTRELAEKLARLLKERGALMPIDKKTGKPIEWPGKV